MKTIKKNLFQITKVLFVFALIIFLNFSNIGSGLFLQNAQATESDTTTSTQNPDLTVSQNLNPDLISDPTPDLILDQTNSLNNLSQESSSDISSSQLSQDSNSDTQEKTNLNSTDSFDPNAIPYFLTGVVPPNSTTSITVRNKWTDSITVSLLSDNLDSTVSVISTTNIGGRFNGTIYYDQTVSSYLKISAINKDGFRGWGSSENTQDSFLRSGGTYSSEAASLVYFPDMRYFTVDAEGTVAANYFFDAFNMGGGITSFPEGSLDISTLTKVGSSFFSRFNCYNSSYPISLPAGSFDTSHIREIGDGFFDNFNDGGNLTQLPEGSFDTSNFTSAGDYFFGAFNSDGGQLTSLPEGSFDTSNFTSAGDYFFSWFNYSGSLTSLPDYSFDVSSITSAGYAFFAGFNQSGSLTSLPEGSFDISNIITAGQNFFSWFNQSGSLTSLPEGSFNTSNITTVDYNFFGNFNYDGSLRSLPAGSFNFDALISITAKYFLDVFNYSGSLTSLPYNSFKFPNLETAPTALGQFNESGALTKVDNGVSIRNINNGDREFFWAAGSKYPAGSETLAHGATFCCYKSDPFFITETVPPSSNATTITITNKWTDKIYLFIQSADDDSTLSVISIPGSSAATITYIPTVSSFLAITGTNLRNWRYVESPLIQASGESASNFETFVNISDISDFTTDSSGTQAGDNFFSYFFKDTKATSLPADSFDTSSITSAGNNFFNSFNFRGSLTQLPAGSFNFVSLESLGSGFAGWFNLSGSLTSLPYNSFQFPKVVNAVGALPLFNSGGALTKVDNGVSIRNINNGDREFFWAAGSKYPAGIETLAHGATFCCYKSDPFFITETVPPSSNATTITITNKWTDKIYLFIQSADDDSTLSVISIPGSSAATITYTPTVSSFLAITGTNLRNWRYVESPLIQASGESASQFETFVNISDISDFTTDSSGTQAGDNFFSYFFKDTKATSLPAGSFDTSSITTAGNNFFASFNYDGSLTTLPVNSFNTSSITTVGDYFFASFNYDGSLTTLPPNSFNTSSITSFGGDFLIYFNKSGQITKNPSSGISIMNPTDGNVIFYYPSGSDDIPSGSTFSFYGAYTVFILSFDSTGGSEVSSITAQQGDKFTQPANPTKSGYEFTEWVRQNGTPYDWNDTASGNLTLYASWTRTGFPTITNITPKQVQNGKVSTVTITGTGLDDTSYSFGITSTRFGDSSLPTASKIYNKIFPSSSITGRTATSATLKIPSVNWVGTYTIQLLNGSGLLPSKTILIYQLPLGTAKSFTDISKLSSNRQASVKWLAQTGVTGGCNSAGTKYCPEDPVNRGSMAVFLQLLAGYPSGTSKTSSFADVFAGSAKTITYVSGSKTTKTKVSALTEKRIAAVNWLALTGITGGSGSAKVNGKVVNTYRPQDVVNRGSMATFMLKFSENVVSTLTSDNQTGFADVKIGSGNFTITYKGAKKGEKVAKLSAVRATAVKWMLTAGITGGSGTDKSGKVTYRAQDAVNRGSMATFMKNLAVYMKFTS